MAADVAGVLQRGRARRSARRPSTPPRAGQRHDEADAAAAIRACSGPPSARRRHDRHRAGAAAPARAAPARSQAASVITPCGAAPPRCSVRRAQVLALEPRPRRACGRRTGIARQPAQAHQQRVVARADVTRSRLAPSSAQVPRTLAHRRERAPVLRRRRRARAARPGAPASGSPCGRRSRTADAARAAPAHSRSRCTLARIDAAEIACTLASPLTMASRRHVSTGSRLPSTSTLARPQAQALDGAPHRQQRRLQDVERGRSPRRWPARCCSTAPWRGSRRTAARACARRQRLGVAQAADRLPVVEDHGRGDHRPGQRPAAGLVDAGDQARARRSAEAELLSAPRTFSIASVAACAVSRRSCEVQSREALARARRSALGSSSQAQRRMRPALRGVASPCSSSGTDELAAAGCWAGRPRAGSPCASSSAS